MNRKIIHIDMDAFYASVEQRDNPEFRGKAIIVGGSKDTRGVVATASYEARQYGIHSAMSSKVAAKLCPQAVFVRPRMSVYSAESKKIMEILYRFSELVEPLSLDEAYIDVTHNKLNEPLASVLAKQIRLAIFENTGLTSSAGVAPNKFLAKVASDINKPNGMCVIPPEKIAEFLPELPVRKIPGVGSKTEQKMISLGVSKIADLQQLGLNDLQNVFGKRGKWFFDVARGIDERPVSPYRTRKSISVENTFSSDIRDLETIEEKLHELSTRLLKRLSDKGIRGRTLTLKITFSDFQKITRSKTSEDAFETEEKIITTALSLLKSTQAGTHSLRLLGLGIGSFIDNDGIEVQLNAPEQIEMFRFDLSD